MVNFSQFFTIITISLGWIFYGEFILGTEATTASQAG